MGRIACSVKRNYDQSICVSLEVLACYGLVPWQCGLYRGKKISGYLMSDEYPVNHVREAGRDDCCHPFILLSCM
jgi:hypothetical protein